MFLERLAADEIDVSDEYSSLIASHITNPETLLEVIKALKCKLDTNNLNDFFEPLTEFFEEYNLKKSTILKTSHVFCNCCELYVPSYLCAWVSNNPELFETEVAFFYKLFTYFGSLIKSDVANYPIVDLFDNIDIPLSGQTDREKLKLLASVVKHYDYICKNLLDD
jgi:hypothetical protein